MTENRNRQAALRERRRAQGQQAFTVWTDQETADALRRRFAGKLGGIDWAAVIQAALTKPRTRRE